MDFEQSVATLLPALGYLVTSFLFHTVAVGIGGCLAPRGERAQSLSQGTVQFLVTLATGWAVISFVGIVAGLMGILRPVVVAALLIPMSIFGWVRIVRDRHLGEWGQLARLAWQRLNSIDRLVAAAALALFAVMAAHILVGGLAPDMNQDTMWYHFPVAQQWMLTGEASMMTHNANSLLTLAAESIYAILMPYGGGILCTVIYAEISLLLFAGVVAVAARFAGPIPAVFTMAVVIPLYALSVSPVPVATKNDNFASFFLLGAVMLIYEVLAEPAVPTRRLLFVAGFLLGTAAAAKIMAGVFALPLLFITAFVLMRRPNRNVGFASMGLLAVGGILAYIPWIIRGLKYCGNPVFPMFREWLPRNPEFEPALRASEAMYQFYPASFDGIALAFADLRTKTYIAATNMDVLILAIPVVAVIGLCQRRTHLRAAGISLVFAVAVIFWMRGFNNIVRFAAIALPLAAPLFGVMFRPITAFRPPRGHVLLLALLTFGSVSTFVRKTLHWTEMRTIQWPFRPVLTIDDQLEYASNKETGSLFILFHQVQDAIPADATVLLPQCHYPYYLHRRCYWPDEVVDAILPDWWVGEDPVKWRDALIERQVDFILFTDWENRDPRTDQLLALGVLGNETASGIPAEWRLLSIHSSPAEDASLEIDSSTVD